MGCHTGPAQQHDNQSKNDVGMFELAHRLVDAWRYSEVHRSSGPIRNYAPTAKALTDSEVKSSFFSWENVLTTFLLGFVVRFHPGWVPDGVQKLVYLEVPSQIPIAAGYCLRNGGLAGNAWA